MQDQPTAQPVFPPISPPISPDDAADFVKLVVKHSKAEKLSKKLADPKNRIEQTNDSMKIPHLLDEIKKEEKEVKEKVEVIQKEYNKTATETVQKIMSRKERVDLLANCFLDNLLGKNNEKIGELHVWLDMMRMRKPELVFGLISKILPRSLEITDASERRLSPIVIFNQSSNNPNNQSNQNNQNSSIPPVASVPYKQIEAKSA